MTIARTAPIAAAIAGLVAASALTFVPAYAAGSGSSSTTPTCKRGLVWDKNKRKCVKAKKSSGLSDDNLFEAARDLAYNGRYEEALDTLALAENGDDKRILNYRGYATRKLGRVDEALTYYRAALKVDPDYTLVMEYMGEAFLQQDKPDEARKQLTNIQRVCGTDCREYVMLDKRIRAHN